MMMSSNQPFANVLSVFAGMTTPTEQVETGMIDAGDDIIYPSSIQHTLLTSSLLSPRARVVSSFSSLLSSAMNETPHGIALPLKECHEKLPSLFPTIACHVQNNSGARPERVVCQAPCLLLTRQDPCCFFSLPTMNATASVADQRSVKPFLQCSVSNNLRLPMQWTRHDLAQLPDTLLFHLSKSFMGLIDSRLRSCLSALLRNLRSGAVSPPSSSSSPRHLNMNRRRALARIMLHLLGSRLSPINPRTVVSNFTALHDCYEEEAEDGDTNGGEGGPSAVLPLVLEAVFDFDVLDRLTPVRIEIPGAIQARFADKKNSTANLDDMGESSRNDPLLLQNVEIMLDTAELLRIMMEQARAMVRQAMESAMRISLAATAYQHHPATAMGISAPLLIENLHHPRMMAFQELWDGLEYRRVFSSDELAVKPQDDKPARQGEQNDQEILFGKDESFTVNAKMSSSRNNASNPELSTGTRNNSRSKFAGLTLLTVALSQLKRDSAEETSRISSPSDAADTSTAVMAEQTFKDEQKKESKSVVDPIKKPISQETANAKTKDNF